MVSTCKLNKIVSDKQPPELTFEKMIAKHFLNWRTLMKPTGIQAIYKQIKPHIIDSFISQG